MATPIPNHIYTLGQGIADPVTTDRGSALMRLMLLNQYQQSDNLLEYFDAFFSEMDYLYENIESVYMGRFLDNAVGKQLDIIGAILGQSRGIPSEAVWFGFQGATDIDGLADEATPTDGGLFRSEENLGFDVAPLDDATYRSVLYARAVISNQDSCDIDLVYFVCTILLGRKVSLLSLRTSESLANPTAERWAILDLSTEEVIQSEVDLINYMSYFFIPDGVTFNVNLISAPSSELVVNGTFDTDTSGWFTSAQSLISVLAGQLTVNRNNAGFQNQCYQDVAGTIIGNSYTFSGDLISQTNSTSIQISGDESSGWTGQNIVFVATENPTRISLNCAGLSVAVSVFDNISVVET